MKLRDYVIMEIKIINLVFDYVLLKLGKFIFVSDCCGV